MENNLAGEPSIEAMEGECINVSHKSLASRQRRKLAVSNNALFCLPLIQPKLVNSHQQLYRLYHYGASTLLLSTR